MQRPRRSWLWCLAAAVAVVGWAGSAYAQGPRRGDGPKHGDHEYPPLEELTEGYEKIVSTADGQNSLYNVWIRRRDSQLIAELPRDYARHKYFIALTVASGEPYAGLQFGDTYVYWKQYDNRLALIEPNVEMRSTGDAESKSSVNRLFTDRILLDLPILSMMPQRGPAIDLDELLVGHAWKFFGSKFRVGNSKLVTIKTAKAFPNNLEIGIEVPASDGRLETLHYSISLIPENTGYKTRAADERVGYFTTSYTDLGKFKEGETRTRYITRWHLEKADPSLEVSPPKQPIVFYIEHTTPIRYRRWVREGILAWNKAFEKCGLSNAIEVYYQDAASGAHMEKDPEDVRYNFIRWLSNNQGTAIGPSRVNPLTGEILDADIVLTDGWIRHYWRQFHKVLPESAMEGMSPETLAWLDDHPNWDPRIRLAPPAERNHILAERARLGAQPFGGHPLAQGDSKLMGGHEYDGLIRRQSQTNGLCLAARGMAFDVGLMRMLIEEADDQQAPKEGGKKDGEGPKVDKPKDKEKLIDEMPEAFIGPLVSELVAHEVGHTLGLRHNFKATSVYNVAEINSKAFKGKQLAGSVMDYIPVNMNLQSGEVQGDYCMTSIGPYDYWAIEYGYTPANDLKPILERVAEPELTFATDEDTMGPDPLARRYDFGKNPLDFAANQMRLAKHHRARLIEKFVKDGEGWSKARGGYEMTLKLQTDCLNMMAAWVGGAFVHRDHKGDKNARTPIEVVPTAQQRAALKFVIENAFFDDSFGLTPDILNRMTIDHWLDDEESYRNRLANEPAWPVHDRVMGIQVSALTMLMNPTTLRRVYDNEFRVSADQDVLTLPELLTTINTSIWRELAEVPDRPFSARKPMISSLRRNLQREHLERLIDLTLPGSGFTAAYKPISNLAVVELRSIQDKIDKAIAKVGPKVDPYTQAHLAEAKARIAKSLDAQVIYNARDLGRGGPPQIMFIHEKDGEPKPQN
ncbi:MAG: zinc-dependent metalloprotease [Isosphaeraceae bacterium]|nr:zinc-dependent metalloprotease [Isosphaeraceae bacterium]